MQKKNAAILIFDDVEVLDFSGPYEVFGVTNDLNDFALVHVYTVARTKAPVKARNGLSINPNYAIDQAPNADILIVPGGIGTEAVLEQPEVIAWLKASAGRAEKVMSVCTGALLLAKAGLLDGLRATTHHTAFEELAVLAPSTEIMRGARFVDNGQVLTSGGVSAGIDLSLHVVELVFGKSAAERTAENMEYRRAG